MAIVRDSRFIYFDICLCAEANASFCPLISGGRVHLLSFVVCFCCRFFFCSRYRFIVFLGFITSAHARAKSEREKERENICAVSFIVPFNSSFISNWGWKNGGMQFISYVMFHCNDDFSFQFHCYTPFQRILSPQQRERCGTEQCASRQPYFIIVCAIISLNDFACEYSNEFDRHVSVSAVNLSVD